MRLVWSLTAIALGWSLAAVVIWKMGRWVERTHRYDECALIARAEQVPFWLCPIGDSPPRELEVGEA